MLRKRLLGAVIVRKGWGVQSFGYRKWLPLGRPENLVENLDRWGADGIVVMVVDRENQGPDLKLIKQLGALGLSTPLTYGGGITNSEQALLAVKAGAERLLLDSVLISNPKAILEMASTVGVQALVASLPMVKDTNGAIYHWDYKARKYSALSEGICQLISDENISEVLVIDASGEGTGQGFNVKLFECVKKYTELPILVFGGLADANQIKKLINEPQLAGVVVGNALNYREHAINHLKAAIGNQNLRPHIVKVCK